MAYSPNKLFSITPGTKRVLGVMFGICVLAIFLGYFYYKNINKTEDPRVVKANKSFKYYSQYFKAQKYDEALTFLDKIEAIYQKVPGYKDSFELGVVNNNRAAVYLVQLEQALLSTDNLKIDQRPIFLKLSQKYSHQSKDIYLAWLKRMGNLSKEEIEADTIKYFNEQYPALKGWDLEKLIKKRVERIIKAQIETKRRLSVVYTNIGILERYQNRPKTAQAYYEKAIALWAENYIAANNLNVLLGKPLKKRSLIKALFPPDKDKN